MDTIIKNKDILKDHVVLEFASEMRHKLGPRLKKILLFGSRARGDAREDSDYDMLIVLDKRSPELRSKILEIERGLMDRYGVLVASILRSEEEWNNTQKFPLAYNIAREGILL
jgi:predicted nucleotidyltransferase